MKYFARICRSLLCSRRAFVCRNDQVSLPAQFAVLSTTRLRSSHTRIRSTHSRTVGPVLSQPQARSLSLFGSTRRFMNMDNGNVPILDAPPVSEKATFTLDEKEAQLCGLLDESARAWNQRVDRGEVKEEKVVLRIAGGWVRDKLFGIPSHDLDIAISSLSGLEFANYFFQTFLPTYASTVPIPRVAKISANPDQSKHLETATARFLDLDLDFVGLRSETYANGAAGTGWEGMDVDNGEEAVGSRIPQVKNGTPSEDAYRRDITINALFYNIHDKTVEDFTGKGLADLKSRLIRTPLPPLQTFSDDPLRILRSIRFASRFSFSVDPEIIHSVSSSETVRKRLDKMVSKERVGIEVSKMLDGRDPLEAIRLIKEFGIYDTIFGVRPWVNAPPPPPSPTNAADKALKAASIFSSLLRSSSSNSGSEVPSSFSTSGSSNAAADYSLPPPPSHSDLLQSFPVRPHGTLVDPTWLTNPAGLLKKMWLGVALAPYTRMRRVDKKGKEVLVVEGIIDENLKLSLAERDFVSNLQQAAEMLIPPTPEHFLLLDPDLTSDDGVAPSERLLLGRLLRRLKIHDPIKGSDWRASILFALVISLWRSRPEEYGRIIDSYNSLVERIEALGLDSTAHDKPILNGKEINSITSTKPGKWTAKLIDKVVNWQLDHPSATKEDCEKWLVEMKESGRVKVWAGGAIEGTVGGESKVNAGEGKCRKKRKKGDVQSGG